ncbi:hypothetical protein [Enterococcus hirae]|uniref:hypothetical protein n=1 Tax=Enterococcus hirae TaxID=1354 RepID=UPI0006B1978C|nr:hypothetical protein [Enterococcus hirae]AVH83646.1 hypothetical protein A6J73_13080 [Enterococcus hirae]
MSDGVLGLIGVGISVIGTIGIAIYNQRNVRKQNAKNEKTQNIIRKQQEEFESQMLVQQQEFQERITKKQIDANLKAKARIEWISDVRELVAEYISELSVLQQILFQMIVPVETIQIENENENPRQQIIDGNLEKIEPLLEKLNSQRMKITNLSEKILLFFSSKEDHREIEKQLIYAQNQLMILEIFIRKIKGERLNPTPIDELLPEEFNQFNMRFVSNIKELRSIFRDYFKSEWDRAKQGK